MDGLSWLVVLVLVVAAMVVAACNYALRSLNRIKLEEELARHGRTAWLEPTLRRRGQLILTTGLIRVLLTVMLILTLVYDHWHWVQQSRWLGGLIVGIVAFVLIVVFVVAVPTAWARYAGEALLARVLGPLHACRRVLRPLVAALHGVDEIVRRLSGAPRAADDEEYIERQIMSVVTAGEREGVVDAEEKDMIQSVLQFQDTRVEQIMTPRTDIVAVEASEGLAAVLATIRQAGHSRIPVYLGNLDNIVGVLYAKDLLTMDGGADAAGVDLRQVMREPLFVPESKPLGGLLSELRRRKVHLAIVLDEFGGTAGLVTIEDIVEEIVGEIADEHEQPEPRLIRKVEEHVYELDGRAHVDDINDELGLSLPEGEDYDTISGLVISQLGHIPAAGEKVIQGNVTVTVLDAEPRRINRLRLQIVGPPIPAEPG